MSNITVDLTTLAGYAELPAGQYQIQVTAQKPDAAPSQKSEAAAYEKAAS